MAKALKYATTTMKLFDGDGLGYQINRNQPWDAEDPLVKLHPGYFADEPPEVAHTTVTTEDYDQAAPRGQAQGRRPVEAATKAPGEQRNR